MSRIKIGWELTKVSFKILWKDKELLLLSFFSMVSMISILIGFLTFMSSNPILFLIFSVLPIAVFGSYAYYYFLAAFTEMVMLRLKGKNPKLIDGFRKANDKIDKIFYWSLIAASVAIIIGFLNKLKEKEYHALGITLTIGWTLATFFVMPVLIYENLSLLQSLKKSATIFKNIFGETATGLAAMGLITLPMIFVGIGVILYGIFSQVYFLNLITISGFLIMILGIIVNGALKQILVVGLYAYSKDKKIPLYFDKKIISMIA